MEGAGLAPGQAAASGCAPGQVQERARSPLLVVRTRGAGGPVTGGAAGGARRGRGRKAARLPGPAGARHLPFEEDKEAAALVPDGLELHTSQSKKDAFHAAALRSQLQLRKPPNLSQNGLSHGHMHVVILL